VGVFPHFHPLGFGEVGALVTAGMAPVTHGRDPEVMSLDGPAFTIFELIRVGGHHGAVLVKTDHARSIPDNLQQPAISVHHLSLYCTGLLGMASTFPSALNSFRTRKTLESDKM
jgi:hypothetical protein